MSKLPPFKPFPFSWRERVLSELKGANLAVWMAHYWRSDRDNKVEMSNLQIMQMTGLSHTTVDIAKRWLKANGWLVVDKDAYRDPVTQQWIVAEFTATIPSPDFKGDTTHPDNRGTDQPLKPGYGTSPDFTGTGKSGSSVDTDFLLVDTADSDATRLRSRKEEVEESSASAASPIISEEEFSDLAANELNHYLIPLAKEYGHNGNARDEALKLIPLLERNNLSAAVLPRVIEQTRQREATTGNFFMTDKISTWSGLLKMLAKDGFVSQWRAEQKKKRKSSGVFKDKYGTEIKL